VELGHLAVDNVAAGLPSAAPESGTVAEAQALDTSEFANAGSGTSRSSNLTVSSSAAAQTPAQGRRWGLWLSLTLLGAAGAVALWYWQQGGFDEPDATPPAASLPEPTNDTHSRSGGVPEQPGAEKNAPAKEQRPRGTVGAPSGAEGSVPPVLQIDSLPEQGRMADAGADSRNVPEILAADHDRLGEHAATHRVRRLGKRGAAKNGREELPVAAAEKAADKPGKPTAVAVTPAPKGQAAPAGTPAPSPAADPAAPAAKPDCDPPWYFDAKGIQRAKPVCL
jgi:hypothetical protein